MEFQKRKKSNLIVILIMTVFLTKVVVCQYNSRDGNLFGNLVIYNSNDEYGDLLPNATISLKHKKRVIKIITNEAGLIDAKLPKGTYLLISVHTSEEIKLVFKSNQNKCFEIRDNQTTRFDIVALKPQS